MVGLIANRYNRGLLLNPQFRRPMAVSFVTRFRRHLATIPFVIVLLLPFGAGALFLVRAADDSQSAIAPIQLSRSIEKICVDPDPLTTQLDACPLDPQGGE